MNLKGTLGKDNLQLGSHQVLKQYTQIPGALVFTLTFFRLLKQIVQIRLDGTRCVGGKDKRLIVEELPDFLRPVVFNFIQQNGLLIIPAIEEIDILLIKPILPRLFCRLRT